MHTLSEENYLKCIYKLSAKPDVKVSTSAIAEAISINPASVVDMIRKLTDKQLIEYHKKTGVKLTSKGEQAAIQIVRKHRLWEVFLLEKLNYGWDEIHDIAEELEHIRHHDLANRLDKFLGFPEYDPHGDPIPKANGISAKPYSVTLSTAQDGDDYCVAAVKDTSTSFLQYLHKLQIKIGTPITVVEKIDYDQSLVIRISNGQPVTVSQKFAENILIA